MSVERGAQISAEVEPSLDMTSGFGLKLSPHTLRIWGRDDDPKDPPADPPDGDPQGNQDPPDDPDDDEQDPPSDEDKDKSKEKTPEELLEEQQRENARLKRQIARDKKAADDAEADKDVAKDRDKIKAKLEARDKFLENNLLTMEVIKQKKYKFIDVEDVVRALRDDEDVHIDLDADIPNVEGLDIALKRLAKKKPHWLEKEKEDGDGEPGPPSGSTTRGGGKTESADEEEKRLGEKYKIPGYGTHVSRVM